jgi:hypothetical protein
VLLPVLAGCGPTLLDDEMRHVNDELTYQILIDLMEPAACSDE